MHVEESYLTAYSLFDYGGIHCSLRAVVSWLALVTPSVHISEAGRLAFPTLDRAQWLCYTCVRFIPRA